MWSVKNLKASLERAFPGAQLMRERMRSVPTGPSGVEDAMFMDSDSETGDEKGEMTEAPIRCVDLMFTATIHEIPIRLFLKTSDWTRRVHILKSSAFGRGGRGIWLPITSQSWFLPVCPAKGDAPKTPTEEEDDIVVIVSFQSVDQDDSRVRFEITTASKIYGAITRNSDIKLPKVTLSTKQRGPYVVFASGKGMSANAYECNMFVPVKDIL